MGIVTKKLPDELARRRVLTDLKSTLLVEAGAGTGKTALLAGRVVMLLASNVPPRDIVAITFTEAAASQLSVRIVEYVQALLSNKTPEELKIAFPVGPSEAQIESLSRGLASLDELTCTTIHSFCQQLTRPYPAEASLDPGAVVLDEAQAKALWDRLFERWLRQRLSNEQKEDPVRWLLLNEQEHGRQFIEDIARAELERRDSQICPKQFDTQLYSNLRRAVREFKAVVDRAVKLGIIEETSVMCAEAFEEITPRSSINSKCEMPFGELWRMCEPLEFSECAEAIFTTKGTIRKYRVKGKWQVAAKVAGKAARLGEQLNEEAASAYERVDQALASFTDAIAEVTLSRVMLAVGQFRDEYNAQKRRSAALDFDDLLLNAREMLRRSREVRTTLSNQYHYILVDEFQDTDPVQAEIFFLLCGEGRADSPWWQLRLRPGQLFLVGDPKQSIYRFRRADIACYEQVRQAFLAQFPDSKVEITANFRSQEPILEFVNTRFATVLADVGFAPLRCTVKGAPRNNPCVSRLDIEFADRIEEQRRAEAVRVAQFCRNLLENLQIRNDSRYEPCKPKHIALLAPSGTELWPYEQALEDLGIPISTQAGKGFFRQQEIQDLIAVTRVLSNRRDSLALGALLCGPLVGLSEQELLDIVAELPRQPETAEFSQLTLRTDPALIAHRVARKTLQILRDLSRKAFNTTPFDILNAAVEQLRVRPLLKLRHANHPERSLANIELFLELSRQYGVGGLREFTREMMRRWKDAERQIEGRPDAGADAVQLITLHSAKGLEWPVVIPINMITGYKAASGILFDSKSRELRCKYEPIKTQSYESLQAEENEQRHKERLRMWYVCCTRARDLLVIPYHAKSKTDRSWFQELELHLDELPLASFEELPAYVLSATGPENPQTEEIFERENIKLLKNTIKIKWTHPSATDSEKEPGLQTADLVRQVIKTEKDGEQIVGSVSRGLILHKIMEEVLLGMTDEAAASVKARAIELITQLGLKESPGPNSGISAEEIRDTIIRTLSIPLVRQYRRNLRPEWSLLTAVQTSESSWDATHGVADAIAFDESQRAEIIFDWKSDVVPDSHTVDKHRAQLGDYLRMADCKKGAVVYMTSGLAMEVSS